MNQPQSPLNMLLSLHTKRQEGVATGGTATRRQFIALAGSITASIGWPYAAWAQEPGRIYRIAILAPSGRNTPAIAAFFDELRLNGFSEGQNLSIIVDGFDIRKEQMDELVAKVIKAAPDVIVAYDQAMLALQATNNTLPIVGMSEDMVGEGRVASLARPGGNITGISIMAPELDGKRLDILIELMPGARRMAVVADSKVTPSQHLQDLRDAARARGIDLKVITIARPEEVLSSIDAVKASGAEAVNFLATPLTFIPRAAVFERVSALRLPAIYQWPEMAEEGGLIAYGPRFTELWRQRARFVVKVLRGAKPADLPVEQPTKFDLVVNLRTANELGLTIPVTFLLRADKVIE